jgi:hypothetical protein
MNDYPTFATEKDFQIDLATDLKTLGWSNVRMEVPSRNGSHWLDIVATDHPIHDKGLVIECKASRPSSLTEAMNQLLRYRGTLNNPNAYRWALSWPSDSLSHSDKYRITSNGLEWLNPVQIKDFALNPDREAESILEIVSLNIERLEMLLKIQKDLHRNITSQTDAYKTTKQVLANLRIAEQDNLLQGIRAQALNGAAKEL